MPTDNSQPTVETKPGRRGAGLKRTVAGIVGAAAFGGLGVASANAQTEGHSLKAHEANRAELVTPNKLPGYGIEVNPATIEQLEQSTVEVMTSSGSPGCTGAKIDFNGEKFVVTAAHCEAGLTGVADGAFHLPDASVKAKDYIKLSNLNYVIGDPMVPTSERWQQPSGFVTGISVSTADQDIALLQVGGNGFKPGAVTAGSQHQPDAPDRAQPTVRRGFDQINYMDYSKEDQPGYEPIPGQEVAVFGVPQAANFEPVMGKGVYLGRFTYRNKNGSTRLMDYAALNTQGINYDACNFGASGSVFAANINGGKEVFTSGPLSVRYNVRYDPYNTAYIPPPEGSGIQPGVAYNLEVEREWWSYLQTTTGINLSSFDTVCGYTVVEDLLPGLVAGIGQYAGPEDLANSG